MLEDVDLAALSVLAYDDPGPMTRGISDLGGELLGALDRNGTYLFAAGFGDELVIAFRGTEISDRRDLLNDVDMRLIPADARVSAARVHAGFDRAVTDVWSDLDPFIRAKRDRYREAIHFTGHSLGGALAVLAAVRTVTLIGLALPVRVTTYGQPRVGNAAFVAELDGRPWRRHVRCLDLVTRVPTPVPPIMDGYRHGGDLRYWTRDGRVLRSPSAGVVLADRLGRAGWRPSKWALASIEDHSVEGYLALFG